MCNSLDPERVDEREDRQGDRLVAKYYKAIFALCPDMICVADRQGVLLDVNPACSRILGFSPGEMIGQSWESFAHPDDIDSTHREVARQLSGQCVLDFVNRYRCKTGGYRTMQWQGTLADPGGFIGTARDITDQVQRAGLLASVAQTERRNVRFALHDGIGQQLFGLRMVADQLQRTLQERQPELAAQARYIEQVAHETLGAVRDVMDGLMPFEKRAGGFAEALQRLAGRVEVFHGVKCALAVEESALAISHDLASQIFLIAQEGVMNAVKHAAPTHLTIALGRDEGCLELVVSDNGRGLGLPEGRAGLGFEIMHHRASLIGASLDIAAGPAGGTAIRCRVAMAFETR